MNIINEWYAKDTSKNFEARQDHFVCSTSRLKGKEIYSTHFIRAVVLEQGVLAHMRLTIACVANHEEQFRKAMGTKQKAEAKKELAAKRRQLTQEERRTSQRGIGNSRLTFPMTLWEYSPRLC